MEEMNQTLENMKVSLDAAWDVVEEKDGEVAEHRNLANLPTAIRSIAR